MKINVTSEIYGQSNFQKLCFWKQIFRHKMDFFVKKQIFCQKMDFSSKKGFFVENCIFLQNCILRQKLDLSVKCGFLIKNWIFRTEINFSTRFGFLVKISKKNRFFVAKFDLLSENLHSEIKFLVKHSTFRQKLNVHQKMFFQSKIRFLVTKFRFYSRILLIMISVKKQFHQEIVHKKFYAKKAIFIKRSKNSLVTILFIQFSRVA